MDLGCLLVQDSLVVRLTLRHLQRPHIPSKVPSGYAFLGLTLQPTASLVGQVKWAEPGAHCPLLVDEPSRGLCGLTEPPRGACV